MSRLIFSHGGDFNSSAIRGSQISAKISGDSNKLILDSNYCENKIVIVIKNRGKKDHFLSKLKERGNKLILDVIDWLDKDKYEMSKNVNAPNFFPDFTKDYFDGYIVNNIKMRDWWYENIDRDRSKPVFVIPHHWDFRFSNFDSFDYGKKPYFYYLGQSLKKNQNCLWIEELLKAKVLDEQRSADKYFKDSPVDGCQINIRRTGSFEYCFKPATKLSIASAMGSVIITTKDWSVEDILDDSYPYILKSSDYQSVVEMINYVKETYKTDIWFRAKTILEGVKEKTSLDNIINLYLNIENSFNL